jgi:hypothetical protein
MAPGQIAPPTSFWEFRLHIVKSGLGNIGPMSDQR